MTSWTFVYSISTEDILFFQISDHRENILFAMDPAASATRVKKKHWYRSIMTWFWYSACCVSEGQGHPEGQHGLQHICLRCFKNDKCNNIFS